MRRLIKDIMDKTTQQKVYPRTHLKAVMVDTNTNLEDLIGSDVANRLSTLEGSALDKETAKTTYQPIGDYVTKEDSQNYTDTAIANLVDSAPETLNTLNELATAISEHQDVTDALDAAINNKADKTEIPTKVSQLENNVPYVIDSVMPENGVYAVRADGSLCTINEADNTCIAVALIVNDAPTPQRLMIEKNETKNTTSIKAAYSADGASNTGYTYFYWGMYGSDQSGIPTYSQVGGNSSSWTWGYLPQANGSYYSSSNNLSSDITTWTSGTALGDFNGKANTAALLAASDTDSYTTYANMATWCKTFNETATENQGYTDWYIPACGQLSLMYLNMTAINNALTKIGGQTIASLYYWSSSEYSSNYGWVVGFGNGGVDYGSKYNYYRVRFVRDLTLTKPLKERISEIESIISNLVLKINILEEQIATGGGGGNSEEVIKTVNTYKTELESQIGDMSSVMNEINEDTELSEASLILDEINGSINCNN